ncbi:MAG: acyl-CoA dehydrogenase family protein [Burkholderiaceae bacterium]
MGGLDPDLGTAVDQTSPVPDAHGQNFWRNDPGFAALLPLYASPELCQRLTPRLDHLGDLVGARLFDLAQTADRNPPVLHLRNRRGQDDQRVEYHPAYLEMSRLAFGEFGIAALSHRAGVFGADAPLPPIAKYALTYLFAQGEFGLLCPVSMTDSLTRTLRKFGDAALIARFLPHLASQDMDTLYQGAMFMTEQGAGSDVAATASTAQPLDNGRWALHGDKWFCSNPDADLAFVLARADPARPGFAGVGLFLLPKRLDDGRPNHYKIVRLKDKLGTRSMASGEIALDGAHAWLVGEIGQGFKQMADMVNNSRLSNAVRSAGMMRRALAEALHVARNRVAFGKRLIELPLMQRQLVKMLVRTEQARTMVFQTAETLRRADAGEPDAYALLRILTPLIKFRACRDARQVVGDAMEVRGGCGYIEEFPEPRLLRDAHLGSIWEGTSNIVALDVIRAVKREGSLPVLRAHLSSLAAEARFGALSELWPRVEALVERAKADPAHTRSAASALYHLSASVAMAWEAARLGSDTRRLLAETVLTHRLRPRDPLAAGNGADVDWAPLLAAV